MYKVQILPKAEEDISTKKRTSPRCAFLCVYSRTVTVNVKTCALAN